MWGAVNISPPGRHRAPRSYPRRDGATCHTPRCMTHRRTPRPHDRPHISPPHPAQLSPPRPHHMPHVSVHDRIATRPRPHERPHTSPPRAAQLPAPQLRHRPHASVHDRIAIRRDRMIALTSPHRTRTQLPAPRRCHTPHASVHDVSPHTTTTRSHTPPRPAQLPAPRRCHTPRASVHDASPHAATARSRLGIPRAHPEDALCDRTTGRLGLLCTASVLPHLPCIAVAPHGLKLPRNFSP